MAVTYICVVGCCRGAFVQVKEALEGRFPGIEVNGGSYPVAPVKVTSFTL